MRDVTAYYPLKPDRLVRLFNAVWVEEPKVLETDVCELLGSM